MGAAVRFSQFPLPSCELSTVFAHSQSKKFQRTMTVSCTTTFMIFLLFVVAFPCFATETNSYFKNDRVNTDTLLQWSKQVVVRTKHRNERNILTQNGLLTHSTILEDIARMTVHLYGADWSLHDLCLKPQSLSSHHTSANSTIITSMVNSLLDLFLPCTIMTPLDCFWEGSKPLGPFPPVPLPSIAASFLPSLQNRFNLTWKNLNPQAVVADLHLLLGYQMEAQPVEFAYRYRVSLANRNGVIGSAYQNLPCIDPLDLQCPTSSPNFFDACHIFNDADFKFFNQTSANPLILQAEIVPTCDELLSDHDNLALLRSKRDTEFDSDYYKDYYGGEINDTADGDPLDEIFSNNQYSCYASHDVHCLTYRRSLTEWLRDENALGQRQALISENLRPRLPNIAHQLTGGCRSVVVRSVGGQELLWPETSLFDGIVKAKNGSLESAQGLRTVLLLEKGEVVFKRFASGHKSKPGLDLKQWNVRRANAVLEAWQKQMEKLVLLHQTNFGSNVFQTTVQLPTSAAKNPEADSSIGADLVALLLDAIGAIIIFVTN